MDQDNLISQFKAITDLTDDSADDIQSLLTVNNWDLNNSLSSYFESGFDSIKDSLPHNGTNDFGDFGASSGISELGTGITNEFSERSEIGNSSIHNVNSGYATLNSYELHDLIPKLPFAPKISNNWQFQLGIHQSLAPQQPSRSIWKWLIWIFLLIPRSFINYLISFLFKSPNSFPSRFDYNNYVLGDTKVDLEFPGYKIHQENYNDLYQSCKDDYNWLMVVLVNNENEFFVKDLLADTKFKGLFSDENVYIGNVDKNPEAWEIGNAYHARKTPFIMLINNVSNNPSIMASMSVVFKSNLAASHLDNTSAVIQKLVRNLKKSIDHYQPQLVAAKTDKREIEISRAIKQTQDDAFEKSLEMDRVKKLEKQKQKSKELYELNRLKYLKHIKDTDWFNSMNEGGDIRVQVRLPDSKFVVNLRRDVSLRDFYIHIESILEDVDSVEEGLEDFEHDGNFNFEIVQAYPKKLFNRMDSSIGEEFKSGMSVLIEKREGEFEGEDD